MAARQHGQRGAASLFDRRTPSAMDLEQACSSREVSQALDAASGWLLNQQQTDGHWCAELEGDTILESEYILLLAWLGEEDSPSALKAAQYLLEKQLPGGGWAMYPGGSLEISGSVKAYFALKLTGHDPESPPMQLARGAIRAAGGADAVNSFTRFYLALLGQIPYACCPAVPPEVVLLPNWFPINIYRISSWSRTIVVPLSIMWAQRPVRDFDADRGIRELFLRDPEQWPPLRCPGSASRRVVSWERFFRAVDRAFKGLESWGVRPLRRRALNAATQWMVDRFAESDGLGAIFPPIIWSIIALKSLGYADGSEEVRECRRQLDALVIDEGHSLRLQPCKSPVWDTAIAARALAAAGTAPRDAIDRGLQWLLDREVQVAGDWQQYVKTPPAGWFFEYRNAFYPDVDDTIMVMMALREGTAAIDGPSRIVQPQCAEDAIRRGCEWILAMQNRDGGWGAFDRDNDREFLCHVPFADHNAMIDPSTPDITGRVLEALAGCGMRVGHPAADRARRFLRRTQEADGSWYGRWGVNYIYGTWQVLVGLVKSGVSTSDTMVTRGADWLLEHQQSCGGWGESARSYEDSALRGQGPPTASQTAWALLGLIAAGLRDHPSVQRGVGYLVRSQQSDGSWRELEFTGTGFPRVFYLRYHMYPMYFPLLALAQYVR